MSVFTVFYFFLMIRRPPKSTRTDTPFPTRRAADLQMKLTLKRSQERLAALELQKRDIDDAILQLKHDVRIIDEFLKVKERSREAPSFKEFIQGRVGQLAEVAE